MSLSIKQKQVLGVTSIVAAVVVLLSINHLTTLTRVMIQQSQARGELIAMAIGHRAVEVVTGEDTGYQELRRDPGVQAALESALYQEEVTYAAIVDPKGLIIASSDRSRVGERLPPGDDLAMLAQADSVTQLRSVYQTERMLEWRQALLLNDSPFAEIRVGLSTLLVRGELDGFLYPALGGAGVALVLSIIVAMGLSQLVLRPIHVIRSGLSRLGQGDLGATLELNELKGTEFRDLGDIFASLTNQLKAAMPNSANRAQLVELSRRVTALGRLTAGVAHEVKNPLNAMTIHLELLKQKLAQQNEPSPADEHVEVISREIRRLDDVVQGFLKFARPEELALQPVAPGEITSDVAQTIEAEAKAAGVAVETKCEPDLPAIEVDPAIFRQALLNLAKNAVQAMPDGGTLSLSCGLGGDGRVDIRVADTGVGIPPENLAKIFDLYFTTKKQGTGIGLSLVYRTIQLHNGDIDVESTPDVGTTFIVRMPRAGTAPTARQPEALTNLRDLKR